MKLRNKKTGELANILILDDEQDFIRVYTDAGWHDYDSLAELNEEWEDKPAEPLIKDEKIRKAVRAWADANGRDLFRAINEHFNRCKIIGYTDGGNAGCDKIEFSTTIAGANKDHYYTIAELCGEEKE